MQVYIEKPDGSRVPITETDTGTNPDHTGPGVISGATSRRDLSFLNDYEQVSVSIERVRPIWAAGHCDTIPLELDESGKPFFSPDEIRQMYGGEKYVCRFLDERGRYIGCRTLHFRGLPPLVNGLVIEDPNIVKQREKEERENERRKAAKESESDNLIKYLMEQQKAANEQALALLRAQVERQSDPLQGVNQMLTMFQALEKFKGRDSGGDSGGMMAGLLELLKNGALSAPAPAPAPAFSGFMGAAAPARLSAPVPAPVPAPVSAPVAAPVVSVARPENQEYNESEDPDITIADELAEMNDQELVGVVVDLLGRLGDERSIKLFEALSKLGDQSSPGVDAAARSNI